MNRPLLALWITQAGCLSPVDPGAPDFFADSTLGFWVVGSAEERGLIAFDPADPIYPAPTTIVEGWLTGLGFQGPTLNSLGLKANAEASVPEGRPLPQPDARVRWTAPGWLPEPPNLVGLEALRLPPIVAARCAEVELCLDSNQGVCEPCRPDPAAVVAPIGPSPPLPLRATCPAGWSPFGPEDRRACAWEHPGPCGAGAVALPGDRGCAPLLAPCPEGDGFSPPGPGRTIYVRAGAAGGDGTAVAPLGQLGDALVRAATGDRIALAPGRYGAAEVPEGVEVVGACAARVVLEGGTLRLRGGTLRDLSLEVPVLISGTSTLAGIQSRGVVGVAFNVEEGGVLHARRLSIRGATSGGIVVTSAQAELEQVEVQSPGTFSVWVNSSTVSITGAAIDFASQNGAIVAVRSRLRLADFLVDGETGQGITGQQSRLELQNGRVVITDGLGISLQRGHLALRQLWLQQVPQGAVALHRATGELSDLRVEGTPRNAEAAVRSKEASNLLIERVNLTGFAVGVRLVSTPGTLRDLAITDLSSTDLNAPRSVGIQANGAGPFLIERARIGVFVGHAIAIAGDGAPGQELLPSLVRVEDLEAFALSTDLEGEGGVGFFEEGALQVELRRLRIVAASRRGLEIRGFPRGTELVVDDLYVEGSEIAIERSGYGASALQAVELRDSSDRGIELRGRPFLAQAVRIVGSGGRRGLSLTPSEVSDDPIEFKDFLIAGPLGAAVVANGSARGIRLVDGEISDVEVAFGFPEEAGEQFELQNVVLRLRPEQQVTAVGVP